MPIPVGTPAPDFTLKTLTAEGLKDVKLSENFGKAATVLLFFPAAFTGVCTQEMCDTSSGVHAMPGATVYGISGDTPFALDAWAQANKITVTLLSDYDKKVGQAYDVVLPDLVGLGPATHRAAFVIDRDGVVRYSEQTPTPLELPDFAKIKAVLESL